MVKTVLSHHGVFSHVPCRYLIMGYESGLQEETGAVQTAFGREEIGREEFNRLAEQVLGIPKNRIFEFYSSVEHNICTGDVRRAISTCRCTAGGLSGGRILWNRPRMERRAS